MYTSNINATHFCNMSYDITTDTYLACHRKRFSIKTPHKEQCGAPRLNR